jgi:hypothetical protein
MKDDIAARRRPSRWWVAEFLVHGTFGYAQRLAKNVVKKGLGRKPYFTPRDVLFRVYLRQRLGGPKIQNIKCISSIREGAGSQALMMMKAIGLARATGLTYVHTPFSEIWHAGRPMQAWADAWEAHFNLGAGEIGNERAAGDVINYAFTFSMLQALFGVAESGPSFGHEVIREFRRRYYLDKSPRKNDVLAVCVHARRPNSNDFHGGDYTDLPRLARILAQLRSVLDARGIAYTLRLLPGPARGVPRPRCPGGRALSRRRPDLEHAGNDRDILVTGLGNFSYVIGLLCDGTVIADASGSPAGGWIAYEAEGEFDSEMLASRLLHL